MRYRLVALLGVVLVLAGCAHRGAAPPEGFGNGTSLHTIQVGGVERAYRLFKPAQLPPLAPLVVMLHGGFGSARQAERSYDWDELADSAKFLVAYPDGLYRAWNVNGGAAAVGPHATVSTMSRSFKRRWPTSPATFASTRPGFTPPA